MFNSSKFKDIFAYISNEANFSEEIKDLHEITIIKMLSQNILPQGLSTDQVVRALENYYIIELL